MGYGVYDNHTRRRVHVTGFQDESETYIKAGLFADKKRRNHIFVCVVLFAFRDFSGVQVFKKCIQRIYNELYSCKPISYRECAMFVTCLQVRVIYYLTETINFTTAVHSHIYWLCPLQLTFAIVTVFVIEIYGTRKLLLISTFGMILSMLFLEIIIWNHGSNTIDPDNYTYLTIVFIMYIVFYAQGLGSIPWVIQLDKFHRKVMNKY